jgi:DNA end-binding protein Ku
VQRAVWTGTISFGLVSVAVRLYPAVKRRDVRFREIDRRTGRRVHRQRIVDAPAPAPTPVEDALMGTPDAPPALPAPAARHDVEVPREAVVRGYEVDAGRYVTVEDEELAALAPTPTHRLDVEQFVKLSDIDPLYYDVTYHAAPDRDQDRPFALLRDAMAATESAALGWFVLRRIRHLALVRARDDLMTVTTMHHADELVPAPTRTPIVEPALTDRERDVARVLIQTLRGPFEPERYRDERRDAIMSLIESRREDAREAPLETTPVTGVEDLMRALEASLAEARRTRRKRSA